MQLVQRSAHNDGELQGMKHSSAVAQWQNYMGRSYN